MQDHPSDRSEQTSLTLIGQAKAHHQDAWLRLVKLYTPLIAFWVRRAGWRAEDTADLIQEVWTSAGSALEKFHRDEQSGSFRGWLWTITRNKLRDFARKPVVASAIGGTDAQGVLNQIPETAPEDESGHESHAFLHRVLAELRPEYEPHTWQAFWETVVVGKSASEVGAALGLTANAVHQAKFRILNRLRRELAELGESPDSPIPGA